VALANPVQIFPDVAALIGDYLRTAIAARPEAYASGVTVAGYWPEGKAIPARLVTVRDDGGPRLGPVTKLVTIAVNVWAATEADCSDLALLTAALLESAPGDGPPILAHDGATGPVRVPELSGKPHRYLTADLVVRGTDL
jgi:hypothetical protein